LNLFKNPKCDKNSSDVVDKVLLEFSNKFASFMCNILERDQPLPKPHSTDDCLKKLKNLCISIEDYYPHDIEKDNTGDSDDESSDDDDVADEDFKTISANDYVLENEGQKSLLTPSMVNITAAECAELNEKLQKIQNDIDSGAVKATASKKGDKTIPMEVGGDLEGLKIKKKKKPKKKKGKKKNEKCFGKRDIKPQWEIEWRDKTEGGVCSTNEKKS
jgi:hypothetical protein